MEVPFDDFICHVFVDILTSFTILEWFFSQNLRLFSGCHNNPPDGNLLFIPDIFALIGITGIIKGGDEEVFLEGHGDR